MAQERSTPCSWSSDSPAGAWFASGRRPFVFGRGGEEAEAWPSRRALRGGARRDSGVAAPAYAGIPVTHRDGASAVAFVTGHEDPAKTSRRSTGGAGSLSGTLVFYMGSRIGADRRAPAGGRAGRDRARGGGGPGTLPGQREVGGTLADIAERVSAASIRPPAITVVGPVAGLQSTLAWLERRPLHGQTVAVTRARAQAARWPRG